MDIQTAKKFVGRMVMSHDAGAKMIRRGRNAHGPYRLLQITKGGMAILEGRPEQVEPSLLEPSNRMQLKKVYDYQQMPEEVREVFKESRMLHGNHSYVDICVHGGYFKSPDEHGGKEILFQETDEFGTIIAERGDDPVSDWLYDHGADVGEEVVVLFWW